LRSREANIGKEKTNKGRVIDDAFRKEAVRILKSSERAIKAIADDLSVGTSSLGRWKRDLDRVELMAVLYDDVHKELARLRREVEVLRAERDLLEKAIAFFARETSHCRHGLPRRQQTL
jgi:transposase